MASSSADEKETRAPQPNKPSPSSKEPSTSQLLLEIEKKDAQTRRVNGTTSSASLLNIVQLKENTNRKNNINALNEEIQRETKCNGETIINPSKMPAIVPAQPSALLSKLSAFLPQMHEANLQLEEKIKKDPILAKREIEIDAVLDEEEDDDDDDCKSGEEEKGELDKEGEGGKPQIEMSLGMGVVDLKTTEAVEEVEKLVKGGFSNNTDQKKNKNNNNNKKKKIEVL